MNLVFYLTLQDHVIKGSCNFMGASPRLVAIGNWIVEMFLDAGEENSRCSRFHPPLMFISEGHELKVHDISYY